MWAKSRFLARFLTTAHPAWHRKRRNFEFHDVARQPLLIYSFLTFRRHGGWQEQEIVQGQEGPEEENRPLRKEGLVLRQGPLHLRRQRVRHTHTHTPTRTQRSRRGGRGGARDEKRAGDAMREYRTNNWPVSARPSSTAPPV